MYGANNVLPFRVPHVVVGLLSISVAGSETRREGSEWESGPSYGDAADVDEQPDAWTFIHYVSHVSAMHLQVGLLMRFR